MIKTDLLHGELVRLTAEEPELVAQTFARWNRNTEYYRLLDMDPAQLPSMKKIKEWIEKDLEKDQPNEFFFHIRTLQEDRLIGFIGLFGVAWMHGDAWVGIGIGEQDCWGKGYGTDAMRVILRYAFTELNLHRVTLGVFEYNPRAIRSYEKAGFTVEGRERQRLYRDGEHADGFIMGVLREEWLVGHESPGSED
jgi:RimJ/RimL family protein N-acetyltransferase